LFSLRKSNGQRRNGHGAQGVNQGNRLLSDLVSNQRQRGQGHAQAPARRRRGVAKAAGYELIAEYRDDAVKGSDPVDQRPGFAAMLKHIAGNGVRTIVVETASRFARDLIVAETGFRRLRDAWITLIAADAPNSFLDDTPTSAFIRQVLAAVQELDKAIIVSKLKGARQRKRATGAKVEGRKSYGEAVPVAVDRAKALKGEGLTLRQVADRLASEGYQTRVGKPYQFTAVGRMISRRTR
jgi:DNA invertase Pin-like site-specific DNA recombinase